MSNKPSKTRKRDPHYEREAGKYDNPLPSREYVLSTLAERGVPLSFESLADLLDIREHEFDAFQRRLGAMQRDGQIMQNRRGDYLIPDKADLIRGRVEGHPDGYGFLVRDEDGPDIFLGPKEMDKALHGDRVMARIVGMDRRGRPEGKIVEVLERANHRVVGRVHNEHGVLFVVAENRRISQDILLAPGAKPKAVAGQVVVVEIIEQPSKHSQPIGKVVEVLGNYADPGMEIEIALRKHELPFEFSREGLAEAKKLPDAVRKSDWKWEGGVREDIRSLPLVTIDGETAKDFDDAVYCERQGKDGKGGFRLVVAIADVSHYVQAERDLDRDAYERGNSVYFPRRVIPMLPEKLSNGLCSLNPHVERLCMVCDMLITARGEVHAYQFYPAVMRSHARFTYTEVAAILANTRGPEAAKYAERVQDLLHLHDVYRALLQARQARGAVDFETTETQIICDENGRIEKIVPRTRNEAHRLIEEAMLAANEWLLVEIDGAPLPAGAEAPLVLFEGETVRGFAGCNRFTAPVKEVKPGELDVGPGAATKKACPQPQMELEQKFLTQLDAVNRYGYRAGQLALSWQAGESTGVLLFRK